MRSEEQNNASRENGSKSSGPVSSEGKAKASPNSYTHGFTTDAVLLAPQEIPPYEKLVAIVLEHYKPKGPMEQEVVRAIADLEWKLKKATVSEHGIFAKGRRENEHLLLDDDDPDIETRFFIMEGEIQHTYSRTLTNLSMQASRGLRNLEKRIAQFEKMRAEREIVEVAQRNYAMDSIKVGFIGPEHPSVGSVFSLFYLTQRLEFEKTAGRDNIAVFDRTWGANPLPSGFRGAKSPKKPPPSVPCSSRANPKCARSSIPTLYVIIVVNTTPQHYKFA